MRIVDAFDCEELAAHLTGIDYDTCEDSMEIWNALEEKYEMELDNFAQLISDLLPMIQVGTTIDNKVAKGFGVPFGSGVRMVVKIIETKTE